MIIGVDRKSGGRWEVTAAPVRSARGDLLLGRGSPRWSPLYRPSRHFVVILIDRCEPNALQELLVLLLLLTPPFLLLLLLLLVSSHPCQFSIDFFLHKDKEPLNNPGRLVL